SSASATASITVSAAPPVTYHINTGGSAVSPFTADQFFSGGGSFTGNTAVSTAGVANAAPASVYQSERYGDSTYTLPNLTVGSTYTVRLHFAEIYHNAANKRLFNVSVNGAPALTSFDVYTAAGGANKAVVRDFVTTANSSGKIVVSFVSVTDSAKVSGIEVLVGGSTTVSQPPTVAIPAAVAQNPITGTTANLSVLGADDGGESALTYTWSTTGTPPAAVTFSSNASNASKNTVATFSAAGSYSLIVMVRDTDGASTTSSLTFTVSQTLGALNVTPKNAQVAPLATQQFSATQTDQFGAPIAGQPSVTWSVSGGGTISATGLFTAGTTTGGPFTVTASGATVSGTSTFSVSTAPPVTYRINTGGGNVSPFTADQFSTGGSTFSGTANVSIAGVANAAPAAVYQSERYGNLSYVVPGLTVGGAYKVRLHFAEIYLSASNGRLFNVIINGTQVLTSFDVFAAAGGKNKAVARDFSTLADSNGRVTISLVGVKDNAKISGFEIFP
ncbi:MAG TPA: malectin domain-containing carbohydrate-binding protein, partial [Polyangiaceae bacterium]|nr:malectin domain-containing carbohydrate-binding protein [Polyangiaceae bacterium]